jgi:hypothetical protein
VARADTVCVRGWAAGRELGKAPPPEQPLLRAGWLERKVAIGQKTSRGWKLLRRPPGSEAELREILKLYDRGLDAYGQAATAMADGQTGVADRKLREGHRIGTDYRRLAGQHQFRECDKALPIRL